ncbi:MAG: acyl-CoA dehydrogenase family protein [Gemmatimonadota bacterium]
MSMTAEQGELQALARDFVHGEIREATGLWDAQEGVEPSILEKLGELGFLGGRVPEEFGGLELDLPSWLVVLESVAWGDAGLALAVGMHGGVVAHLLGGLGTPAQREKWLPGMASGRPLAAVALWEGSMTAQEVEMDTQARQEGDGWRIQGGKRWVLGLPEVEGMALVFAHRGDDVLAFLSPAQGPGWKVVRREETMGLRTVELNQVELDLHLPMDACLGWEGGAAPASVLLRAVTQIRLTVAAVALGVAQSAYEHAVRYSQERKQFNVTLSEFGAIQEKLAGMSLRVAATRALLREVAEECESASTPTQGHDGPLGMGEVAAQAAQARILASEAAMWVTDEAVQIFGGYGYMRHYPVEKLMRDAKGTEICMESNEMLRTVVAREVLRGGLGSGSAG